jgi:hypothetical protein
MAPAQITLATNAEDRRINRISSKRRELDGKIPPVEFYLDLSKAARRKFRILKKARLFTNEKESRRNDSSYRKYWGDRAFNVFKAFVAANYISNEKFKRLLTGLEPDVDETELQEALAAISPLYTDIDDDNNDRERKDYSETSAQLFIEMPSRPLKFETALPAFQASYDKFKDGCVWGTKTEKSPELIAFRKVGYFCTQNSDLIIDYALRMRNRVIEALADMKFKAACATGRNDYIGGLKFQPENEQFSAHNNLFGRLFMAGKVRSILPRDIKVMSRPRRYKIINAEGNADAIRVGDRNRRWKAIDLQQESRSSGGSSRDGYDAYFSESLDPSLYICSNSKLLFNSMRRNNKSKKFFVS